MSTKEITEYILPRLFVRGKRMRTLTSVEIGNFKVEADILRTV